MSAYGAHGAYGQPITFASTSNGFGVMNPSPAERAYVQSVQDSRLKPFPAEFLKKSGHSPFHVTPERSITTFLSDAQFNTNRVKNELHELFRKHTEGELNDTKRISEINRVRPFVHLAVEKSKLALNNVPGITLEDAIEIEECVKTMEDAFKKDDINMLDISIAMRYANDLESIWNSNLEHLNMGKIEKKLGSYAMGQLVGSAKGGKRTRRNRKRTHRNRKRTHRNRNRKHTRTQRK
jgi:hypothetical protein